jgi:hypothetical protein
MKVIFRSLSPSEIRVLVRFNVGKPKFEIQVNWPAIMLHLNPIEYLWDNITLIVCLYVSLYSTIQRKKVYTGFFTSDNEPGGIGNATHNTHKVNVAILNIVLF